MSKKAFILITIASISLLGLSACLGIGLIDVAGTWSGYITWTSGPASGFDSPLTLVLEQEEKSTEITGAVGLTAGTEQFSIPITEGIAGNGVFTVTATGQASIAGQDMVISVVLEGQRNGDVLTGTGTQTNDGAPYTFDWSAAMQASAQ